MKEHTVVALIDEDMIANQTSQDQQLASYLATSSLNTQKNEWESENIDYMNFSDLEIIGMAKKAPKKSDEEEEEDFDFDEDEFELEEFDFEEDFDDDFDDLDFLDEEDYEDDYF